MGLAGMLYSCSCDTVRFLLSQSHIYQVQWISTYSVHATMYEFKFLSSSFPPTNLPLKYLYTTYNMIMQKVDIIFHTWPTAISYISTPSAHQSTLAP